MAKKTRKSSRKSRRRTRRRRGGGSSYPIVPVDAAIRVSTAGDNSDNLMGMQPAK